MDSTVGHVYHLSACPVMNEYWMTFANVALYQKI